MSWMGIALVVIGLYLALPAFFLGLGPKIIKFFKRLGTSDIRYVIGGIKGDRPCEILLCPPLKMGGWGGFKRLFQAKPGSRIRRGFFFFNFRHFRHFSAL